MSIFLSKLVTIDILCPDCGREGRRVTKADVWEIWMNYCPSCSWRYYD